MILAIHMAAASVDDVFNASDTASLQLAAQQCSTLGIGSFAIVNLSPGTYIVDEPIVFQGPGSLRLQSNSGGPALIQCSPDNSQGSALQLSANSSLALQGIAFSDCASTAVQISMVVSDETATVNISACSFTNCSGLPAGALLVSTVAAEGRPAEASATTGVTMSGCTFQSSNVAPPSDPPSGPSDMTGHAAVIAAGDGVALGVVIEGNSAFLSSGDLTPAGESGASVLYVGCGASLDPETVPPPPCSLRLSNSLWSLNSAVASPGALMNCSGAPSCSLEIDTCKFESNAHSFINRELDISVGDGFKVRSVSVILIDGSGGLLPF